MKITLYYWSIIWISILFISCNKKDQINGPSTEKIHLNIQTVVGDFSDNLKNFKMASNYSYAPSYTTSEDFNKDFMIVAEILPFTEGENKNGPKLLRSNRKIAEVPELNTDNVYRLMVYDNTGRFLAKRDYIRGSENDTEALELYKNTNYTFIAYSLNEAILADLDPLLYVDDTQNPTLNYIESNSTLSNTYIWGRENKDLLFYRRTLTTQNNDIQYLNIELKHLYNLIQTTIDVTDTGYSIEELAAGLVTETNSVQINFENGGFKRFTRNGSASFNVFNFSSVGGIAKSISTSDPVIINSKSGENLLEITSLKIGTIAQSAKITPYKTNGVPLTPGYRYNLSVKIIPKDSIYKVGEYEVARINGLVWMRHNLGADYNANPDLPGEEIQGSYYQWGKRLPFLSGTATSVSNYTNTTDTYDHYGPRNTTFFTNWNRGTDTNPEKGDLDPCPDGFRLPTLPEYQTLISNTTASQVNGSNANSEFNKAMRLTSKRKSSVILTFPAQGYVGESWNGSNYNPHAINSRGASSYTKASSYNNKGTATENNISYIKFEYILLQGLTGSSIFTGPGGGKISANTVGHAVRCIAIGNNGRILLNDRETNGSNQTVTY